MDILIFILSVQASWGIAAPTNNDGVPSSSNDTDPSKDMYVIHAMVYQLGIITNKTDGTSGKMTGDQEALTLYHSNGSNIDLSSLPTPLLTNVTAQGMVEVAPALPANSKYGAAPLPWVNLEHLDPLLSLVSAKNAEKDNRTTLSRTTRASGIMLNKDDYDFKSYAKALLKRSTKPSEGNKDAAVKTPVKIIKGAAVIPQEAGVQSLAFPPLLSFNNNFTEIPVPIPNTSIVHYAKVNTLIRAP